MGSLGPWRQAGSGWYSSNQCRPSGWWILALPGPSGIPWIRGSPAPQETYRVSVDPGPLDPHQVGPGLRGSCGCWRRRARLTADTLDKLSCLSTPSRRDPSTAHFRSSGPWPRARLPTADNLARGPAARARPRPRAPAIKTFRLRAPAPPVAPLPRLPAASSLGALWAPVAGPARTWGFQ